jgi:hypothetical protein
MGLFTCRLGDRATQKTFEGGSHTGLLSDKRLIREVIRIATKERKSAPWTDLGREARWAWADLRDALRRPFRDARSSGDSLRQAPFAAAASVYSQGPLAQ